jgi:dTDP-D-glucose 4,6-dehydratase
MKSRQFIDIDQGLFKTVNWYLRKLKNEKWWTENH